MSRKSRQATSTATVHIHVHELAQLYNSLDPSPFWDRDLDREAAAFIEGEFRERQSAAAWHLDVHIRSGETDVESLQTAVQNYYGRLVHSARLELREHLRTAQLAFLAGLLFFALCFTARELLRTALHGLPRAIDEGLIILAWLSLWRPTENLAFEWVPLRRRVQLYARLARIKVHLRAA
jgi:hypothetical protein